MKKIQMKHLFFSLIVASILGTTNAFAATPTMPSEVHVIGYAEKEVIPDTAYISVGVETTGTTPIAAQKENNSLMTKLYNCAVSFGLANTDMKTEQFSIYPNYDEKGTHIVSYTVTNTLRLKLHNLKHISPLLTQLTEQGANKIHSISFTSEHIGQIQLTLLQEAIKNGKKIAEVAAQAADKQVGSIKEITISDFPASQRIMMRNVDALSASTAPLEPGKNTIRRQVSLIFYLQ